MTLRLEQHIHGMYAGNPGRIHSDEDLSFLIVVLSTYKQMRNQNVAIMSDINEDNFDRAFDILRPGIYCTSPKNDRPNHAFISANGIC